MEVCLVHPAAAVVSEFPAATSRGDADVSAEARRVDESDPAPDPLLHLRGARTAACNEEIREPPGALREVAGATAGGVAEVRAAWRRHRTERGLPDLALTGCQPDRARVGRRGAAGKGCRSWPGERIGRFQPSLPPAKLSSRWREATESTVALVDLNASGAGRAGSGGNDAFSP